MMIFACLWLASIALVLELAHRAPHLDDEMRPVDEAAYRRLRQARSKQAAL